MFALVHTLASNSSQYSVTSQHHHIHFCSRSIERIINGPDSAICVERRRQCIGKWVHTRCIFRQSRFWVWFWLCCLIKRKGILASRRSRNHFTRSVRQSISHQLLLRITYCIDIICIIPRVVTHTITKFHINSKLLDEFSWIAVSVIADSINSCLACYTITSRNNDTGKVFIEAETTTATVVHQLVVAIYAIFVIIHQRWIGICSICTVLAHPDTAFIIKLYLCTKMVNHSVGTITVVSLVAIKPLFSRSSGPSLVLAPCILIATERRLYIR